uniref:Tyrosine-protein phosphatase domain-containing protein n=1 Tax=Malurus cyaneus samueli TaxID=2593467 RepID=A0A8C5T2H7_9PASS
MAGVMLCEPRDLYNIINQYRWRSRLSEPNYLCLLDARPQNEFNASHIVTAERIVRELDCFEPYPVEILPEKLYMGNFKQASDEKIQTDLKIKALVNISEEPMEVGAVLVCSSLGISRSSTVTMAYLMHSCRFSLQRAWKYLLKCKMNMRPNRGFVEQLSAWETQIYGTTVTDTSEPKY